MHPTPSPEWGQGGLAAPWTAHARDLARWARRRLVVRGDAYGGHRDDGRRTTCHSPPTLDRLARHFRAEDASDVIGLHVASPDEMCKTTWVDIDAHDGHDADPDANLRLARHVRDEARGLGLDVRLLDSNGKGGYHVLMVHGVLVPMADSWRLGKYLLRDHGDFGFAELPESFPKGPVLTGKRFGHWVRLPGRHHKRDHYTRVWSPRRERWLEGGAAIASLLKLTGRRVEPAAVVPPDFAPQVRKSRHTTIADDPIADNLDGPEHRRDLALAGQALAYLGVPYQDDYDTWLKVGMALRQLGTDGYGLWDGWSRGSKKYEPGATAAKWGSFAPGAAAGGVTLGTLFHWAKAEGWAGACAEYDPETGVRRTTSRSGRRGTITIPTRPTGANTAGGGR